MILRHQWLWLGALTLLACERADVPKEPVWNKQPCDQCHMLLSDPRYAAQLSTEDGERKYFDDIGCLAAYWLTHSSPTARAWVRQGEQWRDAKQTHYATGAATPMGYGFVPSSNGALTFDAVLHAVAEKNQHEVAP